MIYLLTLLVSLVIIVFLFMQQPIFGAKAKGKRLAKIQQSPNYKNGSFQNLSFTPSLAEGHSMPKVMWNFLTDNTENKKPKTLIPSVKTDLKSQNNTEDFLIWMGHSSYYFQVDGVNFLVDPVFSGNASPIPGTTKSFLGADIYQAEDFPELDYLIISHDHYDHLDYKTIKSLKSKVKKVVCALGVGAHLERWGFSENQIIELDWYDNFDLNNGIKITSTPARHFSGRGFKRNISLWSSYVLKTPHHNIFIGGDSGYDTHFKKIGAEFGPFDWAILENGQYNEAWHYIHTLPSEILKVAEDLNVKNIIPVHSGKFALAQHSWTEPLEKISENSQNTDFKIFTPKNGEKLNLNDYSQEFSQWWKS